MLSKEQRKQLRQKNLVDIEACWARFKEKFPTKMSCLMEIYRVLGEGILRCRACNEKLSLTDERYIICPGCKKRHWYTASSLLERLRRPDAWLATFFFFEDGTAISANCLAGLVGCSPDTTQNCRRKLAYCLEQSMMKEDSFASDELLYSYCKRSWETLPRQHPRSEEAEFERAENERKERRAAEENPSFPNAELRRFEETSDENVTSPPGFGEDSGFATVPSSDNHAETGATKSTGGESLFCDDSPEGIVLGCLSSTPKSLEVLQQESGLDIGPLAAALSMLELSALIKAVGVRYIRIERDPPPPPSCQVPLSERLARVIDCYRDFVDVYWHGVSRKYAQLYLACFWYMVARQDLPACYLTDNCSRFGYINFDTMLDYVSPLTLALDKIDPPPLAAALVLPNWPKRS